MSKAAMAMRLSVPNKGRSISRRLSQVEVVQAPDNITLPRSARDGRVQRRIQDHLRLLKRRQLTKVAQDLEERQIAWQSRFADAPKHPQVGLPTICQPQFVKFLPHLYDRLTMNPARIVADTLT
jgi:hypothetical protein